jgi:hypothetical protein
MMVPGMTASIGTIGPTIARAVRLAIGAVSLWVHGFTGAAGWVLI